MSTLALPTGRRGQALALALALVCLASLWLAICAPLLAWYQARQERLQDQAALAARMENLAASLPRLRAAAAPAGGVPAPATLLDDASDALAAARVQGVLEGLARRTNVTLASVQTLPPEPAGQATRIGLRIATAAPWSALVALLEAIETATPRLLVDDLQLRRLPFRNEAAESPVDAALTVLAFRASTPVAR
jgi:general secretion pathway protein M